jgi:diguanylate cyclase (GGDEF)-like protein
MRFAPVSEQEYAASEPGVDATMSFDFDKLRSLPVVDERDLVAQHYGEVQQLLPVLGPLFGLAVILFNLWDVWIDADHAWAALGVRLLCVLVGALAYWPSALRWTPAQRCGFIYATHAGAVIACEALLKDGLLYGLAGVVACVFTVSVVTLRIRTFLLILATPSALFVALVAIRLPLLGLVNHLMLYVFSVGMACVVMLIVRSFQRRAFLFEKELIHISRHDSLTGAYNRRYLTELAEREMAGARRHARPLAVAMIDIDHFKAVNDNYGHKVGDEVIQKLSATCTSQLRVIDHFGRIGGEEFVCVLPETSQAEALNCAERLRLSLAALRIDTPRGPLRFTVSIGVALLDATHADWSALLRDADGALYRAKRGGRNRVEFADAGHRATQLWDENVT